MDPFSNIDKRLAAWVDAHADEIVATTQGLMRIPSVKGDPAPGAPFGVETAMALQYVLDAGTSRGLVARNLDGYAGHLEWCAAGVVEDADIVGVLAHVDVVPAGDGWAHAPFGAEFDGGVLYGRGAVDDKGPAMAGLFAVLAVAECGVPASKRVRLILGADEESGFGCVKHYFAHEEMPVTGFTPDGRFPVVHAEKGIANIEVVLSGPFTAGTLHLERLSAGRRPNMVPDLAESAWSGAAEEISRLDTALSGANGIQVAERHGDRISVNGLGASAHGSTPDEGVNAVSVLCQSLQDAGFALSPALASVHKWARDTRGGALGIAGRDDVAGELTSNLGIATYDKWRLSLTFNIRYPVTWTADKVVEMARPVAEAAGAAIHLQADQAPLHVPLGDPLIDTLLAVYRTETADIGPPLTMGGGTYARVMRKGVAFGPEFPSGAGGAHQPDEHWPVEHLIRATKIYAKAIARLVA